MSNARLSLSRIIPVRFSAIYDLDYPPSRGGRVERATWWQWRGHIFRHRVRRVA